MVVNLVSNTTAEAIGNSKPLDINRPTKVPSVTPIPAGKKEMTPNNIEV